MNDILRTKFEFKMLNQPIQYLKYIPCVKLKVKMEIITISEIRRCIHMWYVQLQNSLCSSFGTCESFTISNTRF